MDFLAGRVHVRKGEPDRLLTFPGFKLFFTVSSHIIPKDLPKFREQGRVAID